MLLTEDSDFVGGFSVENMIIVTSLLLLVLKELIEEENDREYEDARGSAEVDSIGTEVARRIAKFRTKTGKNQLKTLLSDSEEQDLLW
jgi:hypothetical protein